MQVCSGLISKKPAKPTGRTMSSTTDHGVALLQQGRIKDAENLFGQIVRTSPDDALAYAGLGHCQMRLGREEEAWDSLNIACRLSDRIGQSFSDLAWLAMKRGDSSVALKSAERALVLNANDANAQFIVAQWLFQQQRFGEAEQAFARAAQLHPAYVEARYNLGNDLFDKGDFAAASRHYAAYVQLRPQDLQGWINYGLGLARAGDLTRARAALEKAVALAPDRPKPLALLASVLKQSNASDAELIPVLQRAAALSPESIELHMQLARALIGENAYSEAKVALRRVLQLDPDNLPARWLNFQRPDYAVVPNQAARDGFLARWRDGIEYFSAIDWNDPKFSAQANATIASTTNFYLAYLGEPLVPEQIKNAGVLRQLTRAACPDRVDVPIRRIGRKRRRVAILSPSLHEHSVSRVWSGAVLALDPEEFELGIFYPGETEDASVERFRNHAAHFEAGIRSAEAWIEALRAFTPDILIFLDIGMHQLIQALASLRHAPVQATTWAHPVTSGMRTIDYFLSAELFEPADAQAHYSERLIRLPRLGTYLNPPRVRMETHKRETGGTVRFLCTQYAAKLHPAHDELFARIIEASPEARLDILCNLSVSGAEMLAARMRPTFARFGVDFDERCRVHPKLRVEAYQNFLAQADACLDSLDFSGCITSLDALWADVPVVTLPGALMRGRQTTAMLTLLGLEELIARDQDDYVRIATRAAQEPDWRRSIAQRIAAGKHVLYGDHGVADAFAAFLGSVEPPADPA